MEKMQLTPRCDYIRIAHCTSVFQWQLWTACDARSIGWRTKGH